MAIRHVVLMKFREGTTPEAVQALADGLRALPEIIPELVDYRVGPDLDLAEDTWDALQDPEAGRASLDALRDRYRTLYSEAEAISHSSVIATRPRKKKAGASAPASLPRRVLRKLRG